MLQAELATLRERSHVVEEIRKEIDALAQGEGTGDPHATPADAVNQLKYLQWKTQKRRALQADLARAMAEREAQRKVAERAFGKAEVAKAIAAKKKTAAKLAAARALYNSFS